MEENDETDDDDDCDDDTDNNCIELSRPFGDCDIELLRTLDNEANESISCHKYFFIRLLFMTSPQRTMQRNVARNTQARELILTIGAWFDAFARRLAFGRRAGIILSER